MNTKPTFTLFLEGETSEFYMHSAIATLTPFPPGQNINLRDHQGVTPLHCASKSCGSVPFLRFLKKQGAEKTAKSAEGQSMIHFSAARGHKDAVSYWKRKGQPINARDFQVIFCLCNCCRFCLCFCCCCCSCSCSCSC